MNMPECRAYNHLAGGHAPGVDPNGKPLQPAVLVAIALFATGAAVLWAVALVDVFRRADWEFPRLGPTSNDRVFWTFVVVCLSAVGSFLYYLVVMRPYPRRRR
jgi:hypothetical protein